MPSRRRVPWLLPGLLLVVLAGCSHAPRPALVPAAGEEVGIASYYAARFEGRRTASGERYRAKELTAAHRTLPFGTKVKVTNLKTGKAVIVRINDRGPFIRNRVIDLSFGAAKAVGLTRSGVAKVEVVVLD